MLAIVVTDITNPHHFGLIRGAEAQAAAAGYTLIIGDTQGSAELEAAHIDRLAVDGLILAGSRLTEDALRAVSGPVVLHQRELDGLPSVVSDADDGARQIVEHLAALGHRSVAYLAGPRESWTDGARWRGLAAHAAAAGVAITRHGPFSPTIEHGEAAADVGLASGATALVAFNDLLAIGVLRRLERRGVPVPAAVSVVGHDDIFGADFCHPPLTTVASPAELAGRTLVDLLLGTRPPGQVVLPADLRVRDSTGPALTHTG